MTDYVRKQTEFGTCMVEVLLERVNEILRKAFAQSKAAQSAQIDQTQIHRIPGRNAFTMNTDVVARKYLNYLREDPDSSCM